MKLRECGIPDDHQVHSDIVYPASQDPPPLWDLIWGRIQELHDMGLDGSGVRFGVMDTGYTPHPNLKAPVAARNFTSSGRGQGDVTDRNGHGMWCGGRIGGDGVGIAPGAYFCVAKVLGDNGRGRSDWSQSGREWLAKQGCHVLSVSIGGSHAPGLEQSFDIAYKSGMIIECDAAGNSGRGGVDYPAKSRLGIPVASFRRDGKISNFSSIGNEVDVACPGEQVISTSHRGSGWSTQSGTSMACPFMAGLQCLSIQKLRRKGYSDDEMRGPSFWRQLWTKEGIYERAFEDAGRPGRDSSFGLGKYLILGFVNWLGDYKYV